MNKALHAFVYLFLILAGASLWFELQLNAKRTLLTERNRLQEDYFVKLARTIEKDEPGKDAVIELTKDVSPVEARLVDSPEKENILEDYKPYLEQQGLDTYNWDGKRDQLRAVYLTDADGNPIMDGTRPKDDGPGTERELLETLFKAAQDQQSRLNTTRAELPKLRAKLEEVVEELNALKPIARQDKVTIAEKDEKISALEKEKAELSNQIVAIKSQIEELNGEITSLRDEVQTAKDEAAEKADLLDESEKMVGNLKKMLSEALQSQASGTTGGDSSIATLPFGDKGKIVEVDNENMFAIVEFTDEAMKQLKGDKLDKPIPPFLELGVKRVGGEGANGEFIGRLRLRQEIAGKNYVICDVIAAWKQTDLRADDVVFAD